MPNPKTLREEIREIVRRRHEATVWFIEDAVDEILALKVRVPEKMHQPQFPWQHANEHMEHWKASGWTSCIDEMNKLTGLDHEKS